MKLTANVAEFHKEMESAARRIERTGKVIAKAGREISEAISLPLLAVGFAAFHALLQESTQQFGPLFAAFESLKGEVRALFLALGRELQPVFMEFLGLLRSGVATVRSWIDAFHQLPAGVRSAVIHTLAFLAALGPTLFAVGKMVAAFGALQKALALLLTPTGLIAVAIVGIAAAAIYTATHFDKVKELMLEDLGALVQGFFLGAKAVVLAFDIISLGVAKFTGASDLLRDKLNALEDQTLGKLGGLIFEANERLKALTGTSTTFSDQAIAISEGLKKLNGELERAHRLSQAMGVTHNFAADRARLYQQAIQDLIAKGVDPLNPAIRDLAQSYLQATDNANDFERAVKALGPSLEQQTRAAERFIALVTAGISPHIAADALIAEGKIIQDVLGGIADGIEAIAMHIGDLFSGMSSRVRGFFAAVGAVLANTMKMIGKTLVELGVVSILYGKLGFAIKFFAKNPLGAIAVGAALIALGNQLGASAERISSGTGDTGGGGSSASAPAASSATSQGSTELVLRLETPDGMIDAVFRDPRNRDALARVLEDLSGRNVTTVLARSD